MSGNPSNWLSHRPALPISSTPTNVNWGGFRGLLKQYAGASAGYSLRKIGSGPVVRLRRASDSAESDFTAAELIGSVTGAEVVTNGDFATDTDWTKGTGWTISGGQASYDGTGGFASLLEQSAAVSGVQIGDTFKVTFDVTSSDYSNSGIFIDSNSVLAFLGGLQIQSDGTYSVFVRWTGAGTLDRFAFYANNTTTMTVDNVSLVPYTPTTAESWAINGSSRSKQDANTAFATTWYDQSGTGNDATQATAAAQPKLITAGVTELLNGKPALVFDGVDDNLKVGVTDFDPNEFPYTMATVHSGSTGYVASISEEASSVFYLNIRQQGGNALSTNRGTLASSVVSAANADNKQSLVTAYATSATSHFMALDGSLQPESTTDCGAVNNLDTFSIGQLRYTGTPNYLLGNVQEVILYPSDQSANRTGIETNINDHYGIY